MMLTFLKLASSANWVGVVTTTCLHVHISMRCSYYFPLTGVLLKQVLCIDSRCPQPDHVSDLPRANCDERQHFTLGILALEMPSLSSQQLGVRFEDWPHLKSSEWISVPPESYVISQLGPSSKLTMSKSTVVGSVCQVKHSLPLALYFERTSSDYHVVSSLVWLVVTAKSFMFTILNVAIALSAAYHTLKLNSAGIWRKVTVYCTFSTCWVKAYLLCKEWFEPNVASLASVGSSQISLK